MAASSSFTRDNLRKQTLVAAPSPSRPPSSCCHFFRSPASSLGAPASKRLLFLFPLSQQPRRTNRRVSCPVSGSDQLQHRRSTAAAVFSSPPALRCVPVTSPAVALALHLRRTTTAAAVAGVFLPPATFLLLPSAFTVFLPSFPVSFTTFLFPQFIRIS